MSTEKIFISPRLEGHRFDDHTLPISLMEDFSAFEELIFELAKTIYLNENPQRKRVPKGFTDNVYLKLSKIEEGSTITKILIAVTTSFINPTITVANDEYFSYFEKARDKIFELVEDANSGKSATIDSKFLNYFNRIGKNLEEDESIDFLNSPISTRNVKFSKNTRRKILLSRKEKLGYSEIIHENVLISSIDKKNQIFNIELNNSTFEHPIINDFLDTINLAFQEYENKTLVSLKATGVYNEQLKLVHIEDIQSMDVLDPYDVNVRLQDLLLLEDKWYDGIQGKALDKEKTNIFEITFKNYFNSNLQLPAIFPTLNGDILLEWKKDDIEISLEVSLKDLNAELLYFDMNNDNQDFQKTIDLNTASSWEEINSIISKNII
ncbi:hypothetical protein [uncultured Chryseobacterium sp.]|uniref:hypothetical protein n=1 Tax=uncultured Chryseobacterium sp. TaxID=259322 RepID=UPI0025842BF3|nr:hypothetical protein [uncultured Chryseobacterium sp.]